MLFKMIWLFILMATVIAIATAVSAMVSGGMRMVMKKGPEMKEKWEQMGECMEKKEETYS